VGLHRLPTPLSVDIRRLSSPPHGGQVQVFSLSLLRVGETETLDLTIYFRFCLSAVVSHFCLLYLFRMSTHGNWTLLYIIFIVQFQQFYTPIETINLTWSSTYDQQNYLTGISSLRLLNTVDQDFSVPQPSSKTSLPALHTWLNWMIPRGYVCVCVCVCTNHSTWQSNIASLITIVVQLTSSMTGQC